MKTQFRLRYNSRWGEELFLTGNSTELGNWNPNKAVPMKYEGPGIWSVSVETHGRASLQTTEYKYFIRENGQIHWEDGPNRILPEGKDRVWDWFGLTERQTMKGVAVPLFSLRTEDDLGIGEYADLPKLGDWCVANGLKIIQILPINDTIAHYDWHDSYPYNAISAFALNPIYLNIEKLEGIAFPSIDSQGNDMKGKAINSTAFKRMRTMLNKEESVNYPKVLKAKWKYFQIAFEQQWNALKETSDFQQFVKENEDWLPFYCVYKYFKQQFLQASWKEWERNLQKLTKEQILDVWNDSSLKEELYFYVWEQFIAFKQFKIAADYVKSLGITLKGDLPILLNEDSCDVWAFGDVFNQKARAGSPPDGDNPTGQNWGFPCYDFASQEKDGFTRFLSAEQRLGIRDLLHKSSVEAFCLQETVEVCSHPAADSSLSRDLLCPLSAFIRHHILRPDQDPCFITCGADVHRGCAFQKFFYFHSAAVLSGTSRILRQARLR